MSNLIGGLNSGDFNKVKWARADIWRLCGGMMSGRGFTGIWTGLCSLVHLGMPFTLIQHQDTKLAKREKRGTPSGSFDEKVYIDNIGVPREVPDEFKARNQILAGLELSISGWSTLNKNVDWINYIYYNQQRFIKYTRDAIKGLAEQTEATSLMAWQNRIALDMLLAERGGVCVIFGTMCCTYIPNNTAPDGSVTEASAGLTTLAHGLAENSGVDISLTNWFDSMFGKWKQVMITVLWVTFICVTVLVLCGCCLIPCVRGLISRTLEKSMTQQIVRYGPIPSSDPWSAECMSTEQVDESGSFICGELMFDETIFDI
ncbi:endogenous retrovirus group V member 2 Env polyprotein-like [Oncorhynchus mykiss]|uniref:endogenous retrovirus group V member 2 Env polyprotein-like n=1 Tax=Oncorhynchus mykiss TaxID=8022 RepID=UPI0018788E31|nr:endogenous retrovirus group V member 2 Env polyprotein-like [Oncorhynchus mykiss]